MLLPLVVAGVTLVAFLPVLDAGFLSWDDETNLLNNPHYRGLGWTQLRWMFTTTLLGHYVPITWVSFGLNYLLGGMDPGAITRQSAAARGQRRAALFRGAAALGARVRRGVGTSPAAGYGHAGPGLPISLGAAFAALVFGLHPLRVESVAWVTERRDVLCGLFSLLTVAVYLTAYRRGKPARLDSGWYWMSIHASG